MVNYDRIRKSEDVIFIKMPADPWVTKGFRFLNRVSLERVIFSIEINFTLNAERS